MAWSIACSPMSQFARSVSATQFCWPSVTDQVFLALYFVHANRNLFLFLFGRSSSLADTSSGRSGCESTAAQMWWCISSMRRSRLESGFISLLLFRRTRYDLVCLRPLVYCVVSAGKILLHHGWCGHRSVWGCHSFSLAPFLLYLPPAFSLSLPIVVLFINLF